jgi:type IV fimbrial biogenesis protein FimT
MRQLRETGFTIVELVVTLSIIAIALSLTIPAMTGLLNSAAGKGTTANLVSILNLSRNTAIVEQTTVTVCPLDGSSKCSSDWTRPITAFRDPLRTKAVTYPEQIIRITEPPSHGRLIVKSGIRNYFRFRSSGLAREAIGNITWCPESNDPTGATQVRINMGGRPQLARDTNGDGIVEGTAGTPVECATSPPP